MLRLRLVLLSAALALSFAPPVAEAAEGLEPAIEAWLADDDETALPLLAERAKAGDRDARILLARIESETPPGGASAFYTGLGRRDRIGLLRAPGGLSGRSWLQTLEDDPLAEAFLAAKLPDATTEVAETLIANGADAAGSFLIWEILNRGRWDLIGTLPQQGPMAETLDYLAWIRGYLIENRRLNSEDWTLFFRSEPEGRALGVMAVAKLSNLLGRGQRFTPFLLDVAAGLRANIVPLAERNQLTVFGNRLRQDAERDPVLQPLAAICAAHCSGAMPACMVQAMTAVGGYEGLYVQRTPYAAAIPVARYAGSERARATLMRRIAAFSETTAYGTAVDLPDCLARPVDAIKSAG